MDHILEYLSKLSDGSRHAHMQELEFDERCISTPFMTLPFTPAYESLPFHPNDDTVFYDDDDDDDDDEIKFPDFLLKATQPAHM